MKFIASSTLPEQGVCWDCEKPFGPRAVEAFRGIYPDGALLTHTICVKCADREMRSVDRGTDRYPGRKIIGWVLLGFASVLALFSALAILLVVALPGYNVMWGAMAACAFPLLFLPGLLLLFGGRLLHLVPRPLRLLLLKGTKKW